MSVKDHTVLTPMASLELCTDRMSGFMGPNKPSIFYNYESASRPPCGFWRVDDQQLEN
jgi:hypothetical protein